MSVPKQSRHSVGVAQQYCGQLGKTENCQVAVSLSLVSRKGNLPIAWRLYLPEDCAHDHARLQKAGVPEDVEFATKNAIALAQVKQTLEAGVTPGIVLADLAYGDSAAFRDQLIAWRLTYAVGVRSATCVWSPGVTPCHRNPALEQGVRPRTCAELQGMGRVNQGTGDANSRERLSDRLVV